MHYFRVHPDLWADRLARLAAMGLNTVETYVAWNFHAPAPGTCDFGGWRDLPRFLELAAGAGLGVLLRPGPYICAEWDFGGLPAWLLRSRDAGGPGVERLRCSDARYLNAVDDWFDELIPRIVPYLATRGGPVTAVQVENEYGSYGDDRAYLEHLRDGLVRRGVDVPLFTSDGPDPDFLASGTLPGTLAGVNFGSRSAQAFEVLRKARPGEPLFCMEFWNGWFDHWGEEHHTRDPADAAAELDAILAAGASVNLYMGHGGTNFGLWSGANWEDGLQPTVTSYDYDSAVGEAGELTAKFWAYRDVIAKYAPVPEVPTALREPPRRLSARTLELGGWVPLLDAPGIRGPGNARSAPMPLPMEDAGSGSGLILYRGSVTVPADGRDLVLEGLADRAIVFADGRRLATLTPEHPETRLPGSPAGQPARLEVLVENRGRVNFGTRTGERKGVTGIRLGPRFIHGWESVPIELGEPDFTRGLSFSSKKSAPPNNGTPAFATAAADIGAQADGFLAFPGHGRGFCWLNGFLLGRYDAAGPQRTLYAPAPLWRPGRHDIVILNLERPDCHIEIREHHSVGNDIKH